MTVPDQRQEITVNGGEPPQSPPRGIRIVGGMVILAAAVVIAFAVVWIFAPELTTGSRRAEGLAIRILVTSLIVSSAGGLFMVAMTRNPWWLLAPLIASGMVTLWLVIFGAMGALMH